MHELFYIAIVVFLFTGLIILCLDHGHRGLKYVHKELKRLLKGLGG